MFKFALWFSIAVVCRWGRCELNSPINNAERFSIMSNYVYICRTLLSSPLLCSAQLSSALLLPVGSRVMALQLMCIPHFSYFNQGSSTCSSSGHNHLPVLSLSCMLIVCLIGQKDVRARVFYGRPMAIRNSGPPIGSQAAETIWYFMNFPLRFVYVCSFAWQHSQEQQEAGWGRGRDFCQQDYIFHIELQG